MGRPLVARDEEATTIPLTFERRSATAVTVVALYHIIRWRDRVRGGSGSADLPVETSDEIRTRRQPQGGEGSGLCHLSQLLARRRRGDRVGA